MDDFDDIELINDLATASDVIEVGTVVEASPSDWQVVHEDIQSLHWSIICIYVVCMFCWICKQWG